MGLSSAWSYSSLTAFETCPYRYYVTRVTKQVVEPEGEAQKWGNYVHKAFEDRVNESKPLPDALAPYEGMVSALLSRPGTAVGEQQLAVTAGYEPTGWWDKDAWARCIIDLTLVNGKKAAVLDWKTGKRKPDSTQLMMSAGVIFSHYPEVERVATSFVWLKDDAIDRDLFTRTQVPEIWGSFIPRVRRLEIAFEKEKWPKKPSGLCRAWCPVGKTLCEHCGK